MNEEAAEAIALAKQRLMTALAENRAEVLRAEAGMRLVPDPFYDRYEPDGTVTYTVKVWMPESDTATVHVKENAMTLVGAINDYVAAHDDALRAYDELSAATAREGSARVRKENALSALQPHVERSLKIYPLEDGRVLLLGPKTPPRICKVEDL